MAIYKANKAYYDTIKEMKSNKRLSGKFGTQNYEIFQLAHTGSTSSEKKSENSVVNS